MSRLTDLAPCPKSQQDHLPGLTTVATRIAPKQSQRWLLAFAALLLTAAGAQAQAVFSPTAVSGATQASVIVTAPNGGTVYSVEILTAGAPNMDYTQGSGSSCASTTPLAAGGTCTQSVLFAPSAPGLRIGAVVLLDGSGNVLGTEYLSGTGLGGLAILVPSNVIPVAGDGEYEGPVDNGVPAIQGSLNHPSSVVMDGVGNMYIADRYHHMIRMVCSGAGSATIYGAGVNCTGPGIITTIVGNGNPDYTGDTGQAALATLDSPWGVALDGAGNLYIADSVNNAIRKVSAATGIITTVAGNGAGCPGQSDTVGDGCPAVSAELNSPQGVSIDGSGNLYIADTLNHRIRVVNPVTGIISTVAGNGFMNPDGSGGYAGDNGQASKAKLNQPFAVAFDAQGNMYIPDSANNVVRQVTAVNGVTSGSSTITTFAGTGAGAYTGDGAAATSADLFAPSAVAVDPAGNVYIADTQNARIRKVSSANSSTPGIITSIAANNVGQYYYGGHFLEMSLYGPLGLFLDASGNLYFADSLNMRIREIQSNYVVLDFLGTPIREGFTSGAQNQTVENDGNAPLDVTSITHDANAEIYAAGTTCNTDTPYLAEDADCVVAALFAPSGANPALEGNIYVANDTQPGQVAANSPLDIELIGDGTLDNTTTTTVTSTPNPSDYGQNVVFTVTVTTGSNSGNLTGTVSIFDGTTILVQNLGLNPPKGTTVTATFSTGLLAVGLHSITATYNTSNDSNHYTSTSDAYIQTVNEVTATNLASSASPSALGASVTFTATVTIAGNGGGVTPDGTVTFSDGATILSTVPLPANGVATYATSAIPQGLNAITATYSGDSSVEILGSTSNTVEQDVQASSLPVVTSNLNPSTYGASVTFTITVTSGGAIAPTGVVNILDGGARIGQVTLVGATGQTTFTTSALTVATHQITAAYQGDTNSAASTSSSYPQVVNKATPTLTWATPAAITYGTALSGTQLNATSGGIDGTFVYTPASGTVLAVGAYTLSVTFTPTLTADYTTATATVQLTVNVATPTIEVTSSLSPSTYGAAVTFTAVVSNGPTGNVTFYAGGSEIGSGALAGNFATLTLSTLTVGTYQITASITATGNYNSATSSPIQQVVNMATPVVTWATPAPITYGTALSATQLDATASVGGTFTYTPASGTVPGAGAQTLSVLFTPADSTDYSTATGSVTLIVHKALPVITWATPAAIAYGTPLSAAQLDATASIGGAFTYTPALGVVEQAGVQTLSVTFTPSDATDYTSATDTVQLTVNKATPTLTWATPAAITYGTLLSGTQLDASSGGVAGAFVYAPPAGVELAVGTYTLSVTFTPTSTTNYTTATATVQLTVNVSTPTIAVTSSLPTSTYGVAVTFTAMVSNGPTGIVTFYSDGNAIGTGTLAGNVARLTIATLAVGTHQITASITATGNYNSAASSPIPQVVNMATPAITWATPAPITYGTALSATQLDATASVGGTLAYTPASGTVLGAGAQKLNVLFTPADSTDYSTATGSVTLTVNKAVPVITWAPPAPIAYGTPLSAAQLDATASIGGTFTYTPASGAVVPAGVQTLSAAFTPSDASDYTSPTDTVQLTVNKATPTLVVTTSGSPSYYGATVTLTATLSANATGVVTFYNGTNAIGTGTLAGAAATLNIATLPVGTNIITASWPGNGNYNSVTSGPTPQVVTITQTSTTVSAAPNPAIAGVPLVITATVKVIGGSATPTGSVTFTSGGLTLGNATLNNAGTAAIGPALAPGVYPIVATYSGDANDNTSASSPYSLTVNFAATSTAITSTPNPSVAQSTVTYTAKVTGNGGVPTGPVTFYADGAAMGAAVNLDNTGTAVFTYAGLAAGSHQITAVYGGDADDSTSTSPPITQVVQTIPTVTYLGFASTSGAMPQVILVASVLNASGIATPAPTGTVTFQNGTTVIGSGPVDSNFVATLTLSLPDGSYTITAYYSGDLLHGPSTSAPVTVAIPGAGFNLSVTPAAVTIPTTQNATVTVTLASIDGFADAIGLGCASLPPGVTCHFSTISASLTASESPSPTVQLTIDTDYPLTGGSSSAMNSRSAPPGAYLAGLGLPFSLFFGWVFWRFRGRHATILTTVLVILLSGAALLASGCGGIGASNAIPGTYVIQVTGTAASSGIIHYQNVTLNITAQ